MKKVLIAFSAALLVTSKVAATTVKTTATKSSAPTSEEVAHKVSSFIEAQSEALAAFIDSCPNPDFLKKIGISFTAPDRKVAASGKDVRDHIVTTGKQFATMGAKASAFLHKQITTLQSKLNNEHTKKN